MRKILIVLFALIALSVVGWFGIYQMKSPAIQADIKQRVGEALESNSLDWVEYEVDGRDVTLSGVADSAQMAQHAVDTADIYGLNSLTSNITFGGNSNTAGSSADSGDNINDAKQSQSEGGTSSIDSSASTAITQTPAPVSENTQNPENASDIAEKPADVAVQEVATKGVAALPITMNISRDESGEYIFNGTVPDMELKQTIDQHLVSVGADPAKAVWQVELSTAKAPENWEGNILNSISSVQLLEEGQADLDGNQAVIKGTAVSQDASDAAEVFAQKIAGDYTTEMNFSISEVKPDNSNSKAEELPLVGSDQYAAKFCQTEFNALLKQQKIVFESGSSNLQSVSTSLLDKISEVSARCPTQGIQVHGYTDSRGAASANKKLSKSRAEAVVVYLAQKGVDKERLIAIGHGEKNPVATNKTEAGRAQNRRIKLIVKGLKK